MSVFCVTCGHSSLCSFSLVFSQGLGIDFLKYLRPKNSFKSLKTGSGTCLLHTVGQFRTLYSLPLPICTNSKCEQQVRAQGIFRSFLNMCIHTCAHEFLVSEGYVGAFQNSFPKANAFACKCFREMPPEYLPHHWKRQAKTSPLDIFHEANIQVKTHKHRSLQMRFILQLQLLVPVPEMWLLSSKQSLSWEEGQGQCRLNTTKLLILTENQPVYFIFFPASFS